MEAAARQWPRCGRGRCMQRGGRGTAAAGAGWGGKWKEAGRGMPLLCLRVPKAPGKLRGGGPVSGAGVGPMKTAGNGRGGRRRPGMGLSCGVPLPVGLRDFPPLPEAARGSLPLQWGWGGGQGEPFGPVRAAVGAEGRMRGGLAAGSAGGCAPGRSAPELGGGGRLGWAGAGGDTPGGGLPFPSVVCHLGSGGNVDKAQVGNWTVFLSLPCLIEPLRYQVWAGCRGCNVAPEEGSGTCAGGLQRR